MKILYWNLKLLKSEIKHLIYSNTRSFPDASSRNQAVADATPINKKDETETSHVLPKEKKDTFVPYRKDGSLDYDGNDDLISIFIVDYKTTPISQLYTKMNLNQICQWSRMDRL